MQGWNPKAVNAGIVVTKDRSLCIVFDAPLPAAVKYLEFNIASYQLAVIFDDTEIPGFTLEYPLDYNMVPLLVEQQSVFMSRAEGDQVSEPVRIPVVFINEED